MEIGTVKLIDIDREMRAAYLDYAMSVITARALPDVRDGLKPVQRRILYAMNELGLEHTAAYKKSARIVGEVLGKYHPHGDAPVYETMVRMAQDFSMRYVLVDGQGNFGSVDGDPPAAMRYTEARLAAVAEELLIDLDKNTVDFTDNFDGTLKEPSVLPARLPNLLVNGAAGIAVGMATNIPPHNLREVADAIIFMLDQFQRAVDGGIPFVVAQARVHNRAVERETILGLRKQLSPALKAMVEQDYAAKVAALDKAPTGREQRAELEHSAMLDVIDQMVDVPMARLMEFVTGPDFPTGGFIVGRKGIADAYTTGHGRIVIRAKAFVEEGRGDRSTIIVTELPYQVNKAALVERIADLVRDKRIEGVAELRDESDRQGMRIVIELRREVQARQLLNNLFKLTAMQSAFSVNLLALVDGEPRVLNLKRLLQHYIDYRHQIITRRTQFELDKARARAHILEGLKIALDNLDAVIQTIRNSPDADTARTRLMKQFKLSELQAQAILDMQLRRLAALERKKIEQELADTLKLIGQLEDLLAHPIKMYALIKQDLLDLKQKYGDDRRTQIRDEEAEDFTAEDLIPDEDVVVAVSARNYVKRVDADAYRAQARRSAAARAIISKEQDPATVLVSANTHDTVLFLSNVGKAYAMKCHEIPAAERQARGVPLNNFLSTATNDERIVGMVATRDGGEGSITLITRKGEIKRVALSDMAGTRATGINVMALEQGDEIVWAGATLPGQEIILVTAQGKSIRFEPEIEARASGRGSGGVRAMRLDGDDRVIAVDHVDKDAALLILTTQGFAKRTDMAEYSPQGRGGGGIATATITEKNGPLAAARVVAPGDDIVVISVQGQVVRCAVEDVLRQGRSGRGAKLVEIERGDRPVAILRLRPDKKAPPPAAPEPEATAKAGRKKTGAAALMPVASAGKKGKAAVEPAPKPAGKQAASKATPAVAQAAAKAGPAPKPQAKAELAPKLAPKLAAKKTETTAEPKPEPPATKVTATAEPALRPAAARVGPAPKATATKTEAKAAPKSAATTVTAKTEPPPKPAAKKTDAKAEPAPRPSVVTPAAKIEPAPKIASKKSEAKTETAPKRAAKTAAETTGPAPKPAAGTEKVQATPAPRATGREAPPAPGKTTPAQPAAPAQATPLRRLRSVTPVEPDLEARPAPKQSGERIIKVRSGGKTTYVPHDEEVAAEDSRASGKTARQAKAGEGKQLSLHLWNEEPKKQK